MSSSFSPYRGAGSRERGGGQLGRPVSLVAALTAGLEGVIPGVPEEEEEGAGREKGAGPSRAGLQPRFSREGPGGSSAPRPMDDNNGFLVLPGREGRPLEGDWGGLLGGRYCFKRLIGVGTFAQIIEAEDVLSHAEPKKRVALKVTRAGMQGVGMQESQLLSFLARCPGFHGANIVEAHAAFAFGEHWCVVMELLPGALPDLLRQIRPYSLPMSSMRKLALQLLTSLSFLSSQGVIHADIRPENVLLRDFAGLKRGHGRAPALKVKLSDLGNSFRVSESGAYHDDFELQTLAYRAPEVLYGLPFDTQIDMWSLGCLLVEVYIGRRLFDAFNRSSAVATMAKTLGPIPRQRFSSGRFYSALSSLPVYGTLSVDADGKSSSVPFSQPLISRLTTLLHCEDAGCHSFVSFLAGCLEYDPRHRMTPLAALRHNFVSELCPLAHFLPDATAAATAGFQDARPSCTTEHAAAGGADSDSIKTKGWLKVEPASADQVGALSAPAAAGSRDTGVQEHPMLASSGRGRGREDVKGRDSRVKMSCDGTRAAEAPVEAGLGARASQQQKRSPIRPQAKHAVGRSSESDNDTDARRGSEIWRMSEEEGDDGGAGKEREKRKSSGAGPSTRRGSGGSGVAAGHVRRRVRRAASSGSGSSDEEGKAELAMAMAALEDDDGDDDDGEEYVPSSRRQSSASPQPRERHQRKGAPTEQTVAGQLSIESRGTELDGVKGGAGREGSTGERAKKRAVDPDDEGGLSTAASKSVATKTSTGEAAAKRQRNLAGLVVPTARLGGAGEAGCDFDAEATERRQSRRANLGSKPNEWWVTGGSNPEAAADDKPGTSGEAENDAGARGAGRGKGRSRGRGRGGVGRASSVLHSGSSLLFDS